MENLAVISKMILAIILAVGGALKGNQMVNNLYHSVDTSILSFPYQLTARGKIRQRFLAGILSLIFCMTLLTHEFSISIILLLLMEYILILMTFTDFEQHVILDAMLIPLAFVGIIFAVVSGEPLNHLAAALGGGLGFLILGLITHGAVGGGDIKLIAALGLWLGAVMLLKTIVVGLVAGGIAAGLLMLLGKKKRGEFFAYGPYFTIAAIVLTIFN